MKKIKAAVLEDEYNISYVENYPDPIPGDDDAIVKVHYCGICGSDISNYKYKLYGFTPIVMGHEFSGEIAKLGKNVEGFNLGDKVVGINVALETLSGDMRGLGIFQNGGYAEQVIVNQIDLFKIPPPLSIRDAVMIESFANSVRAMKLSKIGNNEKIMIIGGGNIGLSTLCTLLHEKNPEYIAVIEPQEYLQKMAIELGATEALPPRKNKIKKFIKTHGRPTYIYECAGNVNALILAIDLVQRQGTVLVEGMHKGTIEFPMMLVNSKELTIIGCLGHDKEDIIGSIKIVNEAQNKAAKFIKILGSLKEIKQIFNDIVEPGERDYIKPVIKII